MSKLSRFMKVCKLNKDELKVYLTNWIRNYYKDVVVGDGFIYARGDMDVLLTAHMDTVHDETVRKFISVSKEKIDGRTYHTLTSKQGIGGDDRCGIYMIMNIVEKTKHRPYILFCEDEEVGGVGSKKFVKTEYITELEKMLFLVELDRANADDLVYYEDANKEFHKFCENVTGYHESYGTFSDISVLSPYCMVSSVNISCGYYNAHRTSEYVVFEEMEDSIKATVKLLDASKELEKQFVYEENVYSRGYGYYGCGYGYNSSLYGAYKNERSELYYEYDSDDDGLYYYRKPEDNKDKEDDDSVRVWVFILEDGTEVETLGRSLQEAIGALMIENCELSWSMVYDYYMC